MCTVASFYVFYRRVVCAAFSRIVSLRNEQLDHVSSSDRCRYRTPCKVQERDLERLKSCTLRSRMLSIASTIDLSVFCSQIFGARQHEPHLSCRFLFKVSTLYLICNEVSSILSRFTGLYSYRSSTISVRSRFGWILFGALETDSTFTLVVFTAFRWSNGVSLGAFRVVRKYNPKRKTFEDGSNRSKALEEIENGPRSTVHPIRERKISTARASTIFRKHSRRNRSRGRFNRR